MQPIAQNVLIKPFQINSQTEGGIFVPETAMRPSNKGEVIAAGKGSIVHPMQFKKGDIVYRTKDWGEEIIINGELHYIMNQKAIIAIE